MSENELREYFYIFSECGWKLFKKYSDPVDDDEFWESLLKDVEELVMKSSKKKFAKRILIDTMDEIEAVHKAKLRERRLGGTA